MNCFRHSDWLEYVLAKPMFGNRYETALYLLGGVQVRTVMVLVRHTHRTMGANAQRGFDSQRSSDDNSCCFL